jgi:hypothetical protein
VPVPLSFGARFALRRANATHFREGLRRASNSRLSLEELFCACARYCCVVARTCTCFRGVLAQHIPVAIGCRQQGLPPHLEPDTLSLLGYSQPTSLAARLLSLQLPSQRPASVMLSST